MLVRIFQEDHLHGDGQVGVILAPITCHCAEFLPLSYHGEPN